MVATRLMEGPQIAQARGFMAPVGEPVRCQSRFAVADNADPSRPQIAQARGFMAKTP
jgi:hypothetical protein